MFYNLVVINCLFLLTVAFAAEADSFDIRVVDDLNLYDSSMIAHIERINGISRKYFANKQLLVPSSLIVAKQYSPLYNFRQDLVDCDSSIVVYRSRNLLGVYQRGVLMYWAPITRARSLRATTPGKYQVRRKARLMYSRKYGNAPMPYSLVVVGNVCIHQGPMVGHPASHGCVRLLKADAIWLFQWSRVGVTVIIE